MKKLSITLFIAFIVISCSTKPSNEADQTETTAVVETPVTPDGVYFVFPKEGETVNNPVMVGFGVNGMEIEPAGEVKEGIGHHHIVIDGQYIESGTIIPSDSTNIHFGLGEKETKIELTPGKHTLTLQFGNGVHKSYGEAWSATIEITVADNQ